MAQTIKLRRSSTEGKVPTTAQLSLGELAINTYDGRIFFEKNDGSATIEHILTTDSITTGSITLTGTVTTGTLTLSGLSAQNSEATSLMINGSGVVGTRELGSNAFTSTTIGTTTNALTDGTGIADFSFDGSGAATIATDDSAIVHDNLSGFVANEHIDHSSVSISAGTGLNGGGDLTSTRTLNVDDDYKNTSLNSLTGSLVTKTGSETLTNKTLTAPDINAGTVDSITSLTVANDIDIGAHQLRAETFRSDVSTGTAPFTVASTTAVANLNADMVDGVEAHTLLNTSLNSLTGSLLQNIVEDTSPQLGANLDGQSFNITTTGKILYSNVYATEGDLPSATTYHGMFAHVHATGKGYFAHGGNWIKLIDESSSDTDDLTEGSSNLYFTDARARGAISAGEGIDISSGEISGEDASTSNKGIVELATTAETTTGTDTARAVTPDGLKDGYQGSTNVTTLGTIATGTWNATTIDKAYLDDEVLNTSLNSATGSYLTAPRTVTAGGNTLANGETLAFSAGSNVSISESGGTVTIASTDTNTVDMGDGFTVAADTNTSATTITENDTLTIAGGTNVSTVSNPDGTITINATDTNTQLSTEQVQDIVGGMFSGNTETRITATYQDGDGTIDLVVTDMTANDNDDVSNANLLTRLAALESSGGTSDENIVIGTDSGDTIVITGNLQVNGTTTTVNSTTVNLDDHNIVLDSGNSTSAVIDGAGITLEGGSGDDATFTYSTTGPKFELKLGSSYEDLKVDGLIAASLDISGDVDVDGTLETDALTIGGTTIAEVINDRIGAVVTAGEGIDVTNSDGSNTVTIAGEDATTSNKGIASFSSDNFSVSSGAVTIKDSGVSNDELAGSIADSKLNQITTADKVALSALDIDGATDIGAALVDADLMIVDDGANGTERKATMSRLRTYMQNNLTFTTNTNTQNTTTLSFVDSSDDIILRNTTGGAGSGTQDITINAGSNVTLTHTDANNITIASTDTNTQLSTSDVRGKFSAGEGIDISSGEISGEDASTSNKGIVELATTAETTTGTDTARAVTPDGLKDGYQGSTNVDTLGTITTGTWNGSSISTTYTAAKVTSVSAGAGIDVDTTTGAVTVTAETATATNPGVVELATTAETTTGTDSSRAVTPDGLKDGYQGSTNVDTLGTITTGTWNGSVIASAYLDSDTAHLSGTQTFSGAKTFTGDSKFTGQTNFQIMGDSNAIFMSSSATYDPSNDTGKLYLGGYQSGNTRINGIIVDYEEPAIKLDLDLQTNSQIDMSGTTQSTSKTTGILQVAGGVGIAKTLNVGEDVVAFASSDERYKDLITPIENPNEKIKLLSGNTFVWNDKHEVFKGKKDIGVIAQEVEKVLPEIVETRDNGYKAVKYEKIVALLIESNKELIKRVEELESKIK